MPFGFWPGYWHGGEQVAETREVGRVGGEQREFLGDSHGRDHQVHRPSPRLTTGADYGRHDLPVSTCGFHPKGDGVELVLGPLQHVETACPLGVLLIFGLLTARSHLMRSGGQFRRG